MLFFKIIFQQISYYSMMVIKLLYLIAKHFNIIAWVYCSRSNTVCCAILIFINKNWNRIVHYALYRYQIFIFYHNIYYYYHSSQTTGNALKKKSRICKCIIQYNTYILVYIILYLHHSCIRVYLSYLLRII